MAHRALGDQSVQPLFRFAPTPNGYLHLGHAFSALANERLAKALSGEVLLRIEDIDQARARPDFVAAIHEDLAWLGLQYKGLVRVQSQHFDFYQAKAQVLIDRGLLYRCSCTRKDIKEQALQSGAGCDPDGAPLHQGLCRETPLDPEQPFAWRLDMALALSTIDAPLMIHCLDEKGLRFERVAEPQRWGDVVLLRKDIPSSYHLAVVLDDALQGISHVVRGQDLEASTDLHRLLQALLDLPSPLYCHHRLITDEDGQKLSKSKLSKPLRQWRAEGLSAREIRRLLGFEA
jgi:glutamyl-Q tRNA(Asp) synthetase